MRSLITCLICITLISFTHSQNHSLNFDGADDFIAIPHSPSLLIGANAFTLELLFKAPNVDQASAIIAKRQPVIPFNVMSLFINNGVDPTSTPDPGKKITFNIGTFGGGSYRSITTTNNIVNGNWHHVAAVVDNVAETVVLYIDGALESVNSLSQGSFPLVTNTNPYTIGQANGGIFFYTGQIDEVRIWNVVRTASDIQNNFSTELTGTEAGLVAYYKMDDQNLACDLNDCTSNANHGARGGINGANNLPQYSNDIPSIADVVCTVSFSCDNCSTVNTFTEVLDDNWSTSGNWSAGCVPETPITRNIVIDGNCSFLSVGELILESSATLTIKSGRVLKEGEF